MLESLVLPPIRELQIPVHLVCDCEESYLSNIFVLYMFPINAIKLRIYVHFKSYSIAVVSVSGDFLITLNTLFDTVIMEDHEKGNSLCFLFDNEPIHADCSNFQVTFVLIYIYFFSLFLQRVLY